VERAKVILLIILLVSCAKKAPPPSPDRWAPRLRGVEAVNRRHLRLTFSERLDPESTADISKYTCHETDTEGTLAIIGAAQRDGDEIDLTTAPQSRRSYTLAIKGIEDLSGNEMGLQTIEFMGSETPDRHPPRVLHMSPADGSSNFDPDSAVTVQFSEAMDTTSVTKNSGLLPEGSMRLSWNEGMTDFRLHPQDVLAGEVYSLYLKDGCADIDGNRTEEWHYLTFTPDSVLPAGYVAGYLLSGERGTTLIALVNTLLQIVRIAVMDDTTFRLNWIRPQAYTVLAGMDVDGDRRFDLVGHQDVDVTEKGVVIELPLTVEEEKWRIFERLETLFMID